jgi:hypothetical protein
VVTLLSVEILDGITVEGPDVGTCEGDIICVETVEGKLVSDNSTEEGVGTSEADTVDGVDIVTDEDGGNVGTDSNDTEGAGAKEGSDGSEGKDGSDGNEGNDGKEGAEGVTESDRSEEIDGEVILDASEGGRGTSSGNSSVTSEGEEMDGIKILTARGLLSYTSRSTDLTLGVLSSEGIRPNALGTRAVEKCVDDSSDTV